MGSYQRFMFPILIVFLLIVLIATFRAFLLPYIIEPIALLFWAFWRVISSVDQNIYWILLIVICAILVFRIIPSIRDGTPNPAYNGRKKSLNQVEHWQKLIKEAALGKDESRRFRESLETLLVTVAAQEEQSETTAIKEAISEGRNPLSFPTQRILLFGPRWFRGWANKFLPQDYTLIDETLRWMEIELELKHDNEP
jgi:hypothetical protein